MAIRKVLRIGDPQLRRHAGAVDRFGDAALGTLITDMLCGYEPIRFPRQAQPPRFSGFASE